MSRCSLPSIIPLLSNSVTKTLTFEHTVIANLDEKKIKLTNRKITECMEMEYKSTLQPQTFSEEDLSCNQKYQIKFPKTCSSPLSAVLQL
jgi:hypothetical protein